MNGSLLWILWVLPTLCHGAKYASIFTPFTPHPSPTSQFCTESSYYEILKQQGFFQKHNILRIWPYVFGSSRWWLRCYFSLVNTWTLCQGLSSAASIFWTAMRNIWDRPIGHSTLRPFIVTQKDVNFKVKTLLEDLEKDVKANAEDPELMQHASWMRRPVTL